VRPPELSDRQCSEAVLDIARPGIPWRDLPDQFGPWDAVYNCFRRLATRYDKLRQTFLAFLHLVAC
jgi:transposase